jgi:hypothetical protein
MTPTLHANLGSGFVVTLKGSAGVDCGINATFSLSSAINAASPRGQFWVEFNIQAKKTMHWVPLNYRRFSVCEKSRAVREVLLRMALGCYYESQCNGNKARFDS